MKMTVKDVRKIGVPCAVYDATGKEVLHCVACDTETGEVECLVVDDKGNYIIDGSVARTVKETRPAPLRVERLGKNVK